MEVCEYPHAPVALPPGKEVPVPTEYEVERGWVDARDDLSVTEKK